MSQIFPITTITNIQRKGKKEFQISGYKVVSSNLDDIGLIIGKDLGEVLIKTGVLDQVVEELEEAQDKTTVKMVRDSKKGKKYFDTISLKKYKKQLKNV